MESIAHSDHIGSSNGDATESRTGVTDEINAGRLGDGDRVAEELAGEADRLAPAPSADADPTVEKIKQLLLTEALRFRQNASGFMTVVVCMDEGEELLVHFTQRDGGIDMIARCDPMDAARLGAIWPRLQAALALRRIELAPLRDAAAGRPAASPVTRTDFDSDHRRSRNDTPVNRPDWETWA